MKQAGETLARIHAHGQGWNKPKGFSRKTWDIDLLKGAEEGTDDKPFWNYLDRDERRVADRGFEEIFEIMDNLGESRATYGLIHADFHHGNFLFSDGSVSVIDFDDSGFGHYAYDIAVALSGVRKRKEYLELSSAFLKGYKAVRPVSVQEETAIGPLIAGRLLMLAIWKAGVRDHKVLQKDAAQFAKQVVGEIPSLFRESRAVDA